MCVDGETGAVGRWVGKCVMSGLYARLSLAASSSLFLLLALYFLTPTAAAVAAAAPPNTSLARLLLLLRLLLRLGLRLKPLLRVLASASKNPLPKSDPRTLFGASIPSGTGRGCSSRSRSRPVRKPGSAYPLSSPRLCSGCAPYSTNPGRS